jgi:hypothetical protein
MADRAPFERTFSPVRRVPDVSLMCDACGYFQYDGMPESHGGGCLNETDPGAIRRHQLEQFGLALSRLLGGDP